MKQFISIILFLLITLSLKSDWNFSNPIISNNGYYSVYFFNDNTGFIQRGLVKKTTNGGMTWTDQTPSYYGQTMTFINSMTGFTGGTIGLITKTTNGGMSWYATNNLQDASVEELYFPSDNTGYAAGYFYGNGGGFVFKSTNSGENWVTIYSNTSNIFSVYFANDNSGYICGGQGKIYRTTNGGSNWTLLNSGTASSLLTMKFINPQTGYAAGGESTVLKTTNGGMNWVNKNAPGNIQLNDLFFTDANTVFILSTGIVGSILKTTNGGDTWEPARLMFSFSFLSTLFFSSVNTGYLGGENFINLKTTDSGLNWFYVSSVTNEHLQSIAFSDTSSGIAVGSNGMILRTTNAGNNWVAQNAVNGNKLNSILSINQSTWLAAGNSGTILKTTNSGLNWVSQISGVNEEIFSSTFLDINTGFVSGNNGIICKTTNGGLTWFQQVTGTTNQLNCIKFINASTGFSCGAGGMFLKTTDAGTTWQSINLGVTNNLKTLFFYSNNGFLAGSGGFVSKTSNAGNNWVNQSNQSGGDINSIYLSSLDTGVMVFSNGGIRVTTNGGINWNQTANQVSPVNFSLNSIFLLNNKKGYIAGNYGIIFKANGFFEPVFGIQNNNNVPHSYSLSQNYPNPFNPVTNIKFELPKPGSVKMTIYDLLGREITQLANQQMQPGSYNVDWDASNYSSGVYICRLSTEGFTSCIKMVLIK